MSPEHIFLFCLLAAVAVVSFFIIMFGKSPPVQKPPQLVVQKKFPQAKAKLHFKEYIVMKRQSAVANYENYLKYQQRLTRQQNVRRLGRQAHQLFNEGFPEFQNPVNRGVFIRALVLELVSRLYQGHSGLSPEWQRQMNEFINDVNGVFVMKQELNRWYREQQADLQARFEAGEMSQEELADDLEELKNIYSDASQRITFN